MKYSNKHLLTMSVLTFSIFSNFNLKAMEEQDDLYADIKIEESTNPSSIPSQQTSSPEQSNPKKRKREQDEEKKAEGEKRQNTGESAASTSSTSSSSSSTPNPGAKGFFWSSNPFSKFKSFFTKANPTESATSNSSSSSSTTSNSSAPYNLQDYQRAKSGDKNLAGANLQGADLRKIDFSGANLKGANLSGANLSYSNFSKADLQDANLENTKIVNASFSKTILINAKLNNAIIVSSNFYKANLENAELNNVYAVGIPLPKQADLSVLGTVGLKNKLQNSILLLKQKQFFKQENMSKINTSFKKAIFKNAKINNSNFIFVDFNSTNFSSTKPEEEIRVKKENIMKYCSLYESILTQTEFQNSNLSNSYFLNILDTIGTVFRNVSLKKAYVQNCGFLKSKFEDINFRNSIIQNLQLTNCEINKVDLSFSKIEKLILDASPLINVAFIKSKISYLHAKNTDCIAENVNFTNTDIDTSIFMGQHIPITAWKTDPTNETLKKISKPKAHTTLQVCECIVYPFFRLSEWTCAKTLPGFTEGYKSVHIFSLNCIFENCIFTHSQITNSFITLSVFNECEGLENLRSAEGTVFSDVRFIQETLYDTLRIKGAKVNCYYDKAHKNYWERNEDIDAYYKNILATIASITFSCVLSGVVPGVVGHFLPQAINHNHFFPDNNNNNH